MSEAPLSTEKDSQAVDRLRHLVPERLWIGMDALGGLILYRTRLPEAQPTIEYMRVLSRDEVEKLASDEGVDVQQLLNSYRRTIEGQRREIARLNSRIEAARKDMRGTYE